VPAAPQLLTVRSLLVVILLVLAGCGPGQDDGDVPREARVIELPGAADNIDFDDIVYSPALQRVLVPARESGLYLIEPDSGNATRVQRSGSVASADEGRGLLFLADRSGGTISVVDAADGRPLSSISTMSAPDYVRYISTTGELWVTEPEASPSGIEIFAVDEGAVPGLRQVAFIPVPEGPEGFTSSATRQMAYTHAGSDLVAIDVASRTVTARWPTGCDGTHGFPRIAERLGVVLASCASDGAVSLLDLDGGRQLGRHEVGGGEALPAYSDRTGHFYVRADPGTAIATLQPSDEGLTLVRQVEVPQVGHCLTADDHGHYWTCDAANGTVLRFDNPDHG
jgi:DNA-binding beta-propeller fold protein YncE